MNALDVLNQLRSNYENIDVDWELILEQGYRKFLTEESVVIDVGGNQGRHTQVYLHDLNCRSVTVFEPVPEMIKILNERFQSHESFELREKALSTSPGRSTFAVNRNAYEESGLKERVFHDPRNKKVDMIEVEVSTLDDELRGFDQVDYIKIDTEGAEVDILLGARETIASHRPILSIEYGYLSYESYGKTKFTLFDLLKEYDYVPFDLLGNRLDTRELWDACIDTYYWDYYGVPAEKSAEFGTRLGGFRLTELPCHAPQPIVKSQRPESGAGFVLPPSA